MPWCMTFNCYMSSNWNQRVHALTVPKSDIPMKYYDYDSPIKVTGWQPVCIVHDAIFHRVQQLVGDILLGDPDLPGGLYRGSDADFHSVPQDERFGHHNSLRHQFHPGSDHHQLGAQCPCPICGRRTTGLCQSCHNKYKGSSVKDCSQKRYRKGEQLYRKAKPSMKKSSKELIKYQTV